MRYLPSLSFDKFWIYAPAMLVFCHSGTSTLSPPGMAPVCSGGQLELTCTTTGGFLAWTFNVFRGNESTVTNILRNILSTDSAGGAMSELIVNSTMFNFSRTSAQDRLPVMSRLLISPVSDGLQGTVINCVDVETSEVSSTTIIVRERDSLQGMAPPNYHAIESDSDQVMPSPAIRKWHNQLAKLFLHMTYKLTTNYWGIPCIIIVHNN